MVEIFSIIKKLSISLFLFSVSAIFAISISYLFEFPFSNPYEIVGPLSSEQFNPITNTYRYFIILIISPILFLLLNSYIRQKKWLILRLIVIIFLLFSQLFTQVNFYKTKFQKIDLFHDGEQLGVGSGMYLFDKQPYSQLYFLHGAFADPLIANWSFRLFGYSIGSYYLFRSLFILFTYGLLLFLLLRLIQSEFLFYAASFYLSGSLLFDSLYRDISIIIYLIILTVAARQKYQNPIILLLLSFFAFFTFYTSIDRGYYLFVSNLLLIGFLLIIGIKQSPIMIQNILKEIKKYFLLWLSGTFLAIVVGFIYFGRTSYLEFIKMTFQIIPSIKPQFDEYHFPPLEIMSIFPYWLPIFLIIIQLTVLGDIIVNHKFRKLDIIITCVYTILGIFYYRKALGRVSLSHVQDAIQFIFLGLFVFLDFLLFRTRRPILRYFTYSGTLAIFILPFFNINRLIPSNITFSDLLTYISLPAISDNHWLTPQEKKLRDTIISHSHRTDKIFLFTDDSAYYYLTKRENSTRFYTAWFASPNIYSQEALLELIINPPKVIIYPDETNKGIDSLPNTLKMPKISEWIKDHYITFDHIGNSYLMIRNENKL